MLTMRSPASTFGHGVSFPPNHFAAKEIPRICQGDYKAIRQSQQISIGKPRRRFVNERFPLNARFDVSRIIEG